MPGGNYPAFGPRTFNQGAWHNCMRCDRKWKAEDETWQRGLLLCPTCVDSGDLLGQREQKIAKVLMDGKVEFEVTEKLRFPVLDVEDSLLF